jgi:transcriptional regulator with XRE-family HTH domain
MKRLRELRESLKLTQEELAKSLNTTQQTIARWESGKSQPNISALKDLALIFGTSVDDLLEYSKSGKKMYSATYCLIQKDHDGFWGHVGIKIADNHFFCFPVTANVVNFLENSLTNINKDGEWILFPTVVNQYVAFQPENLTKVIFIDEAVDMFDDECTFLYPYYGYSLELYRAFIKIEYGNLSKEEARKFIDIFSKKLNNKNIDTNEKNFFNTFMKRLKKLFNNQVSEKFIITAVDTFLEEDLFDEEKYYKYMTDINVYYTDGTKDTFYNNDDLLISNLDQIKDSEGQKMIQMEDLEDAPVFIPISKIAIITMPYITILDKEKEIEQELKND